jgi:hypothetical protein
VFWACGLLKSKILSVHEKESTPTPVQQYPSAPLHKCRYNWTSTPTGEADIHSTFGFNAGRDFTDNMDIGHFAMAVTTIVPEPETYAMLLAGLGLVGFIARRRKQIL